MHNSNLFAKLNSSLIYTILNQLSAIDFINCISTCRLLYKYTTNDVIVSELCHNKLIEIIPSDLKKMLNAIIIPNCEYLSCNQIVASELFRTIDFNAIGLPDYTKLWFLLRLLINVDKISIPSKKRLMDKSNPFIVNGYQVCDRYLFIGEFRLDCYIRLISLSKDKITRAVTKTKIKGMYINMSNISIGNFDSGAYCSGFMLSKGYIGSVLTGRKHGKGIDFEDDIYEGEWHFDNPWGTGKYTWSDGTIYDGQWYNNKRHGYGRYIWTDGRTYGGQWFADKKNGYGELTTTWGITYKGSYKKDKHDGLGKIYHQDGSSWEGHWINGIPTSNNALHQNIRYLINSRKCTKIMADVPKKYCQVLCKHRGSKNNTSVCVTCSNTCCLFNTSLMVSYWTIGDNICYCPCKKFE